MDISTASMVRWGNRDSDREVQGCGCVHERPVIGTVSPVGLVQLALDDGGRGKGPNHLACQVGGACVRKSTFGDRKLSNR
jgi:hypothetical protein